MKTRRSLPLVHVVTPRWTKPVPLLGWPYVFHGWGSYDQYSRPVPASSEAVAAGMKHFARYCALCHGNDGSGKGTAYARGFFPKAPDMRAAATQDLRAAKS